MVKIKRAYEPAVSGDGVRILVDRLWPRGLTRERAHIDEWSRELAPSDALRKWFAHDIARWKGFRTKYIRELREPDKKIRLAQLRNLARRKTVTLVFAAKDELHCNAVVLAGLLNRRTARGA